MGGAEKTYKKTRRPPPKKNEIIVAAGQHILQQRKECHVRSDAFVGVYSQSLGHRHVGNPATASVAHVGQNYGAQKKSNARGKLMTDQLPY
jgi:hypothetical protein